MVGIVGRRTLWRLGRALYLSARADGPNDQRANGELLIQRQILDAHVRQRPLVIFDVGANVGAWTWSILEEACARGIDDIQVHAFEPAPATFETLTGRIAQHPFSSSVSLVPRAVSAGSGTTEIFVVAKDAGTNSLYRDSVETQQSVTVEKVSVADYCTANRIRRVDLLKCDTEGHDMEVLKGARELFEGNRIVACQFEYNHRWIYARHYLKDVFDFASDLTYHVGKLTPRGIEIYEEWHPELDRFFEGNYVLIQASAVPMFATWSGRFDSYNTFSSLE
jgi:FkbM family methyltransferase